MAMNVSETKDGDVMMDINTTPLIDVMLVLLVMLIITIPIQTHATKLEMPRPNLVPPDTEPVVVRLVIDFDGTVSWDGVVVPSTKVLREYFQSAAIDQPEIHLEPSSLVKFDYVAKVLALAQKTGVKRIGFAGNEQYQ